MALTVSNQANQDGVVARIDELGPAALENTDRVHEQGAPVGRRLPGHSLEPALRLHRERVRHALLSFVENAERKVLSRAEMRENAGAMVHANQHQRRVKGDGCKGIYGKPVRRAIARAHGRDGDSGGELGAHAAEPVGVPVCRRGLKRFVRCS